MKKLILLLIALPLLLANCTKGDQTEGPTNNTVTSYKGIFSTGTIDANLVETPAIVVVTENSPTSWSMSLEVQGETPQVLVTTKSGDAIQFLNQTYQGNVVNGKGELTNNGDQLRFNVESSGNTTVSQVGVFLGGKQ